MAKTANLEKLYEGALAATRAQTAAVTKSLKKEKTSYMVDTISDAYEVNSKQGGIKGARSDVRGKHTDFSGVQASSWDSRKWVFAAWRDEAGVVHESTNPRQIAQVVAIHRGPPAPRVPHFEKKDIPGDYTVELSAVPNPDFGETRSTFHIVGSGNFKIKSLDEAVIVVKAFIQKNNLGGGNFTGGTIRKGTRAIGRVSYNGRIWNTENGEVHHTLSLIGLLNESHPELKKFMGRE